MSRRLAGAVLAMSLLLLVPAAPAHGLAVSVAQGAYGAILRCDPSSPKFYAMEGSNALVHGSINIVNAGSRALAWSVTDNADWLSLSPASGVGKGKLSVRVDSTGLAAGSYYATVTVTDEHAINSPLSVMVELQVTPESEIADRYAVVIGENDYDNRRGTTDLGWCRRDATEIADALAEYCGYWPGNVKVLLDADKATIETAIRTWLALREGPDSQVMIFFSGHGGPVADVHGDEADGYDEALWATDDRAILDDEMNQWLDELDAQVIITAFDACYSGGFVNTPTGEMSDRKPRLSDVFAQDISASGRMAIAACAADEVSFDDPVLHNGILTYYLIEALGSAEADTSGDGVVSVEEAFAYLAPRVLEYSTEGAEPMHAQFFDGVAGEVPWAVLPAGVIGSVPYPNLATPVTPTMINWIDPAGASPMGTSWRAGAGGGITMGGSR